MDRFFIEGPPLKASAAIRIVYREYAKLLTRHTWSYPIIIVRQEHAKIDQNIIEITV